MQAFCGWLSFVGNVTSIIGFFMTLVILLGIKNLKESYVARITVPGQLKTLLKLRDKINENLSGEFGEPNKNEILEVLSEISAHVENLSPKLKAVDSKRFKKEFLPNIERFKQARTLFVSSPSKDHARDINLIVLELTRSFQLFVSEDDWRRTK